MIYRYVICILLLEHEIYCTLYLYIKHIHLKTIGILVLYLIKKKGEAQLFSYEYYLFALK
jgi:hypothetical protein